MTWLAVTHRVEVLKRTDPFVMWLVDVLVEDGEMKPSVHPIDTVVGEEQVTKKRVSLWYV